MTVIIANPIKNPRKRLIQLKKVGTRWMDVRELSQQLIEGLGDEVFNYQTRTTFLFHILKQFSSISRTLEPIDDSIERACGKVLKHFGLDRTTKVKVLTKTGNHEVSRKPKSKTEEFCQTILGIVKPPSIAYRELLSLVTGDLQSLTKLIQWYEEQTIIRKYLKSQEQPRNHHDKMIYDFYLRCTNERIEILNYQLNGLKKRAIEKSKYRPNWISGLLWSEDLYDRPYHFARPFSMPYFDCQRIDLSGHRISEFYLDEAVKLQNLYSENKAKFYRLYFKRIPIDQHFNDLKFHLPHLPLSKNRDPIFDELISLFKGRRWISFYALALPQVEGLFSEMCQAVSPENDFSQKSLTQKVKTVRPFHDLSISYFDYYEYFIPFQRNKFSHTGYDEDFKLKSYDLLLDLTHLLKIFFELDNPLVKIKKLHVRRNYEDFISLPEFVDYFGLIEKLKTVQKKSVKADIETFERTFLVTDCGIQYTCYEMIQGTPILLKTLIFEIELILSEFDEVKLKELNKIKIQQLMERTEILGAVKNYFISHDKEEETLVTYHNFIKYFKRHLPSLDAEIKTELEKIKSEYGELLNNLSLMTELCKN